MSDFNSSTLSLNRSVPQLLKYCTHQQNTHPDLSSTRLASPQMWPIHSLHWARPPPPNTCLQNTESRRWERWAEENLEVWSQLAWHRWADLTCLCSGLWEQEEQTKSWDSWTNQREISTLLAGLKTFEMWQLSSHDEQKRLEWFTPTQIHSHSSCYVN